MLNRVFTLTGALALVATTANAAPANQTDLGHPLGNRYSPLSQINRDNVTELELAWEYHTGDVAGDDEAGRLIAFEDQPSLIAGNLVICSPGRQLAALDPATGEERWRFDPESPEFGMKKCRGIASWTDPEAEPGAACATRIFLGAADNRLFAIDAANGRRCQDFGTQGQVQIYPTKPEIMEGELMITSRPAIVNGVVVVGSSVADNQRVDAPSGRILAFDARTGEQRWEFDPLPRDPNDPAAASWERGTAEGFGGGNVWSDMSVDNALDLVYLPTTSPSGDFYGGGRAGDNLYSTSLVALRGATGEVAWHFQFVHHNVFDYDLPAQPLLFDFHDGDRRIPAVLQNTKTGLIFVFDRATGEPLVPIEERPVPQGGAVAGEVLSPTQPFPVGMPSIMPLGFTEDDVWGFTPIDRWLCRRKVQSLLTGPLFTPPSEQGTIFSPAAGGGPNWGGAGIDPQSNIMVVPTNRMPMVVKLMPAQEGATAEDSLGEELMTFKFPVAGSNYHYQISPLTAPGPCSKPPFAALTAVDLTHRKILWEVPLGSIAGMLGLPVSWNFGQIGTPGAGAPLVTAGGLVFIGYSLDNRFRAFDLQTGEVLWQTKLPAAGTAVPVSYEVDGQQYVVMPAGGHTMYMSKMGDSVMAYRLKKP
jgi:quinoprotein glucose dehydrogenase